MEQGRGGKAGRQTRILEIQPWVTPALRARGLGVVEQASAREGGGVAFPERFFSRPNIRWNAAPACQKHSRQSIHFLGAEKVQKHVLHAADPSPRSRPWAGFLHGQKEGISIDFLTISSHLLMIPRD